MASIVLLSLIIFDQNIQIKKSKKYSLPIERDKLDDERGYYLHPELYNQPEEQSLMRLHHPVPAQQ
jgi:hypothetical protein